MSLLPNRLPYWFGRFGARFISFSDGVTFRTHQIAERGLQCCKLELVAEVEGFPGHDAPTMNDGLRDHAKPHPEQHAGGRQASRFPYHLPEGLRKLLVAHDAGGRAVKRPMDPGVSRARATSPTSSATWIQGSHWVPGSTGPPNPRRNWATCCANPPWGCASRT